MYELKEILQENNTLLKEILAILKKFDSEKYQYEQDARQLMVNMAANALYELLRDNDDFKNKIKNNFKL